MSDETLRAFRAARTMNAFRTASAAATEVVEPPAPTEVVEAGCVECEATVDPDDGPLSASIVAAAAVATYPPEHFEVWDGGKENTPLQVTKDGRVFGMVAGTGCFRNGDTSSCFKYEKDPDPKMSNFHTGSVTLDNGEVIRVGALVAGTMHANTTMTLQEQRRHHEDTSRAWALVRAFEDSRGRLCVTGSVIPGLDPTFQAQAASSPISIERWPVPGVRGTTLVGAVSVISPAWPVH
jgi:hypothetical protein